MKKSHCFVVLVCLMLMAAGFAAPAEAAPPPTWRVGYLVAVFNDTTTTHRIQFPGSPIDCTDTFNSDWCINVTCGTLASNSTYDCQSAPITNVCLAYQISSGNALMITGVDSDACK